MTIKTHMEFISGLFKMETGLEANKIFQIGFNDYMVEASDGKTYRLIG